MWCSSMGQQTVLVFCIVGVLVFASRVQAQEPRGTPGVDYPNYFTIPETSFECSQQKYNPGFYADLETKCQAFHFCYQDRKESFLCPTGTIFNQAVLTCDVWYKSNCSLAQMFYSINAGPIMERAGKNLPMLLRLRNRSQNKPSIQTTTSTVFDKVSSLYEIEKSSVQTSSNELEAETPDKSIDTLSDDKDEKQMMSDQHEQDSEGGEEINNSVSNENAEEEMDNNLVYDSADDRYYREYDQSDEDWQNSEPVNDEFDNFYGYDRNVDYEDDASESRLNDIENESFDDLTVVDDSKFPEFTKRSSQVEQSRFRRKPVYLVLDQPEVENGENIRAVDKDSSNMSSSEIREGKQINITSEESVDEATQSPEPFPRPTRIPHHQLELSTETPLTSEEFESTIIRELVLPHQPEDIGEDAAEGPDGVWVGVSQLPTEAPDTQSDDETIYIENDLESDAYSPYVSEYEDVVVIPQSEESYAETYSDSQDKERELSDTDDTLVVIPDEYDNLADSASSEDSEIDYPAETEYEAQVLADTQPQMGYGTYENYQYSSSADYPEYYAQSVNYPEMYENVMPSDQRYSYENGYENVMPSDQRYSYENGYEYPGQMPVSYESSNFDTENAYTHPEQYPYESDFEVTERPLQLPVTEADLDSLSNEDFNEIADEGLSEQEPEQTEDVYYVLDEDEEQSSEDDETKENEKNESMVLEESSLEKLDEVSNQNQSLELTNSSDDSSVMNEQLDIEAEKYDQSTKTVENSDWSLNSLETSQKELDEKSPEIKPVKTQPSSNFEYSSQPAPVKHESLSSINTQSFPSNMGSFDFSTDSRFLNNMGYSESMDFGPYGFGPNMGQQFSMMEQMQQNTINNPFSQRMGQTEQPKLSTLSAIQEKMRSMKQGKFGAFKKYISSAKK